MSSVTKFSAITDVSSTVASGALSCQISFAWNAPTAVAASIAEGLVAVPTARVPPLPAENEALAEADGLSDALGESEADGDRDADGLSEALALDDGLMDAEGDSDALGLSDALALADGDREPEGETERLGLVDSDADGLRLKEGEAERLREGEVEELGESEALGDSLSEDDGDKLADGLSLAEMEAEGDSEALGEIEALGLTDADAGPKAVTTFANRRTITAPLTLNKLPVPTAPLPVLPLKVTSFSKVKPQSVSTTGAPFVAILLLTPILFPFLFKQLSTHHRKSHAFSTSTSTKS